MLNIEKAITEMCWKEDVQIIEVPDSKITTEVIGRCSNLDVMLKISTRANKPIPR